MREKIYFRIYTALHRATTDRLQEVMICDHAHPAGKNTPHKRVVWSTDKKEIVEAKLPKNATSLFEFYYDFDSEINIYHDKDFWRKKIKSNTQG